MTLCRISGRENKWMDGWSGIISKDIIVIIFVRLLKSISVLTIVCPGACIQKAEHVCKIDVLFILVENPGIIGS